MHFRPSRHAYGCSTPCTCSASGYGSADRDTLSNLAKVALFFGVIFAVAVASPKEST